MTAAVDIDSVGPCATDGEIAAINLESARRRAWARFATDPRLPGAAEAVLDYERMTVQFLGDLDALDRLDALASEFAAVDASFRPALLEAEVASMAHRFADARDLLARAEMLAGPSDAIDRQRLTIDQACGRVLDTVLASRHRVAAERGRLEDLVPLGAVLADLERFGEADEVYRKAFRSYDGASPFPLAWLCFQLGMLWGELVPEPDTGLAAAWYRRAINYLPGYVKARVHLAEVLAVEGRMGEAEALLEPVICSPDPEARWRFADVLIAQSRLEEGQAHLDAARSGFERLLAKHRLAFADHAAEFYAASGADYRRALELARINAANRPTRRAVRRALAIAASAGELTAELGSLTPWSNRLISLAVIPSATEAIDHPPTAPRTGKGR